MRFSEIECLKAESSETRRKSCQSPPIFDEPVCGDVWGLLSVVDWQAVIDLFSGLLSSFSRDSLYQVLGSLQ